MMFYTCLLIIFVIHTSICILTAATDEPFFRNDYTYDRNVNLFLKTSRLKKKWGEGVDQCKCEGAEMVLPSSLRESAHIIHFSKFLTMWLGAHDLFSEGDFTTLDGRSLDSVYANWQPGEPNNLNNEHCAIMLIDGTYNDVSCESKFHYVCMKSAQHITRNDDCETYDLEYVYAKELGRCYKYHKVPKSWNRAFKICRAEQAYLAIINSDSEAQLFVKKIKSHNPKDMKENFDKSTIHLGFSDILQKGEFTTIDGIPILMSGYSHWATGQPDNYLEKEHCGSMSLSGKLNDVDCNNRALFICEKEISKNKIKSS